MAVQKSKRKESRFEAWHNFFELRKEVTNLILMDFGFKEEKYLEQMEKYRKAHRTAENVEAVCERWEMKCNSFKVWFIDEEGKAILDIMRNIMTEFSIGNSIFPSGTHAKLMEFLQRRYHLNKAIGYCFALKQEIQYVIETLPVDINKFERFADMIDKEIALIKGVRQASNKMLKPPDRARPNSLNGLVGKLFEDIAEVIRKIGRIEAEAEGEDKK